MNQIREIQDAIAEHNAAGELLIAEVEAKRQKEREQSANSAIEDEYLSDDSHSDVESDSDSIRLPKTPAGKEHRAKQRSLRSRLREAKVVLHKIVFLLGDNYHALGRGKEEAEAYEEAETLRKGLLKCMFCLVNRDPG